MKQTFDDILAALLEEYEKNPAQSVDELIGKAVQEAGLSEENKQFLKETNDCIDAFAEKMASLTEAKEEGTSRKAWLLEQMDEAMEGRTEEEKAAIATAISEATEKNVKDMLTQE